MGKYQVEDDKGRKLILEGDTEPTEDDIKQAFSETYPETSIGQKIGQGIGAVARTGNQLLEGATGGLYGKTLGAVPATIGNIAQGQGIGEAYNNAVSQNEASNNEGNQTIGSLVKGTGMSLPILASGGTAAPAVMGNVGKTAMGVGKNINKVLNPEIGGNLISKALGQGVYQAILSKASNPDNDMGAILSGALGTAGTVASGIANKVKDSNFVKQISGKSISDLSGNLRKRIENIPNQAGREARLQELGDFAIKNKILRENPTDQLLKGHDIIPAENARKYAGSDIGEIYKNASTVRPSLNSDAVVNKILENPKVEGSLGSVNPIAQLIYNVSDIAEDGTRTISVKKLFDAKKEIAGQAYKSIDDNIKKKAVSEIDNILQNELKSADPTGITTDELLALNKRYGNAATIQKALPKKEVSKGDTTAEGPISQVYRKLLSSASGTSASAMNKYGKFVPAGQNIDLLKQSALQNIRGKK